MLKNFFTLVLILNLNLSAQEYRPVCGTIDPSDEQIKLVNANIENSLANSQRTPDDDPVNVLVAWHVIHASSGLGNIPDSQIEAAIEILNMQYNEIFNYYFTLDTITRHENDDWFVFEPSEQSNQSSDEQQMRSETVIDTVHYYNIWSVQTEPEDGSIV